MIGNIKFSVRHYLCVVIVSCMAMKVDGRDQSGGPSIGRRIGIFCDNENNLFQLLKSSGHNVERYEDIERAIEKTPRGQALLILAKDYPNEKTVLPFDFYKRVQKKKLKVFVEFPDRLATGNTGEIKSTIKERLVVTSDLFGTKLRSQSILDAGLYKYVEVLNRASLIEGAKVAGFDKAVYGLENTPHFPVLFEEGGVLISTTKLSNFKTGRYSPHNAWMAAIGGILRYLSIELDEKALQWEPIIQPTFSSTAPISQADYQEAVIRGAEWYEKARVLIHPEWEAHWKSIDVKNPPVGPPMDLKLPSGNGSLGVMEGHSSVINPDGSQQYRYWLRADCVAETAMTLAVANSIENDPKAIGTSFNLMDFLFSSDMFKTPNSKNLEKSSYGLIGWASTHKDMYYGDDNARVILGSILASTTMNKSNWDKQIVELILANFRTSGVKGFRKGALTGSNIDQTTWQVLMDRDLENIAPHYESWLWATYLWLYDKSGYRPLLEKAKKAIGITMANYPTNWKWTNGLQQERARFILPLAWLVRTEDTPQHREWLALLCNDLLSYQIACGALREELGTGNNGKYGAPSSNAQYGTNEAPLIHFNGDPVADMLYTTNFAFFALNEAAQATKEPKYAKAVDKLADFLVRIQATSKVKQDFDGCWFRGFDYDSWEYYGSNADLGWGAWGTLTGWTQSFITTTLVLKLQKTSYWDKTKDSKIGSNVEEVWQKMLPGVEH